MQTVAAQLPDTGLVEDLARLLWEDPHQAEIDLRDAVAGWARGVWGQAFAAWDDHGDRLQIDGEITRQVAASPGRATPLFGTVTFPRARSHPSGAGASVVSTEPIRGLTTGGDGRGGRSCGGDHGEPAGAGWHDAADACGRAG